MQYYDAFRRWLPVHRPEGRWTQNSRNTCLADVKGKRRRLKTTLVWKNIAAGSRVYGPSRASILFYFSRVTLRAIRH